MVLYMTRYYYSDMDSNHLIFLRIFISPDVPGLYYNILSPYHNIIITSRLISLPYVSQVGDGT